MGLRIDNSFPIVLNNIEQFNNKEAIRHFLLNQWIQENAGAKYRYFAEVLANGNRIYLERPGRLNKGCDFVIYIENTYLWGNGNDRPPDHKYILNDLSSKNQLLNPAEWASLISSIGSIYNCEPYSIASQYISHLPIINGHSYELLLKTIRWFFIEQDITYWSGQGRVMFFHAIQNL